MFSSQKKFVVSHAPFWHCGSNLRERSYTTLLATLPAVVFGILQYGIPAIAVVCLSVSTAILWETLMNRLMKRPDTVGDGNAALIGIVLAMLMPAPTPWWIVITGTFIAIVIAKQIFGGIGSNPFNPAALAMAILMVSWADFFDFDQALRNYDFGFIAAYPLATLKHFGVDAINGYSLRGLLLGQQAGGIGATFGIGLIVGGLYLIARGFIRLEIAFSYLAGVFITAMLFNITNPAAYAGPFFHIFTGYTLIAAFFLMPEDSSSPVNPVPMILYGLLGGIMTVLIRNIGAYVDGAIFAVLVANLVNPLLDKIRPKALGKVM
ncbi:MAG: RnfABCDGE type electron transport complex subunit D [Pseudomonadota bacterium]